MNQTTDYTIQNEGSVFLVHSQNTAALKHLQEHTDGQWHGKALAVEPRFVPELVEQLIDDGFSVS